MAKRKTNQNQGGNPFFNLLGKIGEALNPIPVFKPIWSTKPSPPQSALESYRRDREALTAEEERRRAEEISQSEFERFMNGEWVGFVSSNVEAGVYYPDSLRLELQFHDGTYYAYYSVGADEAASLFRAPSKGGWVWDVLRIRGTKLGFRKPYVWLSAPSAKQRLWDESTERATAHGAEAERQTREALADNPEALKGAFG